MIGKALKSASVVGVAGIALLATGHPAPLVVPRAGGAGFGVAKIIDAVIEYLKQDNAYCTSGEDVAFTDWNVYYLNGQQFFTDPRIGDFPITFTQAGGVNSDQDGLHHPVFRIKDYNGWEAWDVTQIIADMGGQDEEGDLCWYKHAAGQTALDWKCGIPMKGSTLFGHSLIGGDETDTYAGGWCTAHVAQYQRNEYGNGDKFAFDLIIYDAVGAQIGHIQHQEVDDAGNLAMYSLLPATLDLQTGPSDSDPVTFCYYGECWTCDDSDGGAHACTLGNGRAWGYENGDREGEFGFTC